MSRKKKSKEEKKQEKEQEQEKDYQYLVTIQTRLDFKNDETSPIGYLKIFDRKPDAVAYIEMEIYDNRKSYAFGETNKKNPIEIKKIKWLSNAAVVQWWRKDTDTIWTWTYEIFKIEHAIPIDNNNDKK